MDGNLNEINVSQEANEAETWAATREFELRHRRYRVAQFGIVRTTMEDLTLSMKRFHEILAGKEEDAD